MISVSTCTTDNQWANTDLTVSLCPTCEHRTHTAAEESASWHCNQWTSRHTCLHWHTRSCELPSICCFYIICTTLNKGNALIIYENKLILVIKSQARNGIDIVLLFHYLVYVQISTDDVVPRQLKKSYCRFFLLFSPSLPFPLPPTEHNQLWPASLPLLPFAILSTSFPHYTFVSSSLRHVFLDPPLFLFPCGFKGKNFLVTLFTYIPNRCPNQRQCIFLTSCFTWIV